MPRPELERMTVEQKASMCEHFVRTGDGLGVEEACMLEGDFVAKLFLPAVLGTPENAPRTYQALADLAAAEAEDLDLRQRGMKPGTRISPNLEILEGDDQSPAADALFRIGLAVVVVRDPSCMIWFPGTYAVDPWTLRTFSRLAAQAAAEIAASYPQESAAAPTRRPGPARAARVQGEAVEPRFRADADAPSPPPSRVKAARAAIVNAAPEPELPFDPYDDTVPEPEGEYPPPPPADRGGPPPPPSAAERAAGRGAPRLRQGPLSAGVGGEGMPAQPIEPIQPRIHSRHQR